MCLGFECSWRCFSRWSILEHFIEIDNNLENWISLQINVQKDTAPGIPRRSPIQVLTRPAVA